MCRAVGGLASPECHHNDISTSRALSTIPVCCRIGVAFSKRHSDTKSSCVGGLGQKISFEFGD